MYLSARGNQQLYEHASAIEFLVSTTREKTHDRRWSNTKTSNQVLMHQITGDNVQRKIHTSVTDESKQERWRGLEIAQIPPDKLPVQFLGVLK